MKLNFFLILFTFCIVSDRSAASECYHYHTKTVYQIEVENEEVYWIKTTRDPNGISIVSRVKTLLGIRKDSVRLVAQDAGGILIANADAYYWLETNPFSFEEHGIGKVIDSKGVTAVIGTNTFRINGQWKQVKYDAYSNNPAIKNIAGLLNNVEVITHFEEGRGHCYLLKDKEKVYSYDEDAGKVSVIPKLDASQTHFETTSWAYDSQFLYDNNTFYLIDINFENPEEITEQFISQGFKKDFTAGKLMKTGDNIFFDFKDSLLWGYVKAGISLQGGGDTYFYPVENAIWMEQPELIRYKGGGFYNDIWSLIYEQGAVDVSNVKNIDNLRLTDWGIYTDGEFAYFLKYEEDIKIMVRMTPTESADILSLIKTCQYFSGLNSYNNPASPFWANDNTIIYWNANLNHIQKEIKHQSPIRDLKVAYAFDDKLLIEDTLLTITADRESLSFIGSTVDVVSPCDGGRGQIAVVVEYNYYFKDKTAVYRYHSGKNTLEKLENKNPADYGEDNWYDKVMDKKEQ